MLLISLVQFVFIHRRDVTRGERSYQWKVSALLVSVTLAQAVIGIVQSRLGVPAVLVTFHMLGASVLSALITFQWLAIRGKTVRAD
jgi:cytochrome c oxidase assembly protein subunit 15